MEIREEGNTARMFGGERARWGGDGCGRWMEEGERGGEARQKFPHNGGVRRNFPSDSFSPIRLSKIPPMHPPHLRLFSQKSAENLVIGDVFQRTTSRAVFWMFFANPVGSARPAVGLPKRPSWCGVRSARDSGPFVPELSIFLLPPGGALHPRCVHFTASWLGWSRSLFVNCNETKSYPRMSVGGAKSLRWGGGVGEDGGI